MYILFGVLFALCVLLFIICFFRRKHIVRKICHMGFCEKLNLLNDLAGQFGFCYLPDQDIIASRLDSWQKNFGYCSLYDKSASRFNMIFDCEPVYFDYENQTWLIEFWKGQYGINIGGEIGIYKADTIVPLNQYERTVFYGVSEDEMLHATMNLYFKGYPLFNVQRTHWWLTGFRMGSYCKPEDLTMEISLTFPNEEMLKCFVKSLNCLGYNDCDLSICDLSVSFCFSIPHTWQPRFSRRFSCWNSRWQNQFFCCLYNLITRPFTCTLDKVLFLYYFLPAAFRHLLRFKKNRKQKKRKCNKKNKSAYHQNEQEK